MTQAVLRTERLTLVPLADGHLEDEIALDADPQVMRFLDRPRTREQVVARHAERLAVAARTTGLGFWAGLRDDAFVGWWLLDEAERPDEAELGYRLAARFWRQGFASEGARELLRHGFDDLGLQRVFGETMAVNAGSRAVMASLGMSYVRTVHGTWDDPLPGWEQGEVEYAITRSQWRARARS
ncbi:GNAT family N-acetyltransferase [Jatrophihabitans fulvus]